jgi:predicted Zn finger-like uncharacterized protein
MITRCPSCSTTFRVTPEQLQAHGGKVRCGQCRTVFDGLRALVAPPGAAAAPVGGAGAGEAAGFALEPVDAAAVQPAPARSPEIAYEERGYGPVPEQLSLDEDLFPDPARARRARVWAAGSTLLLLVLAGQAAYFQRSDLAAQVPGLRPYLLQFCELLACAIAPPQRPRQIAIEASDLQALDKARPGMIQLTATLRNHADHDLGYPALDLVLTNTKEHTLARRIFMPKEYLGRGHDVAAGIPASAEITIRLDLDAGDLNPAGFRLDLLPAPQP